jgi:hypothetical protein
MFPMRQSPHFRRPSQLGLSVQDAIRVGVQDARYVSANERPVYTALITGCQIGIRENSLTKIKTEGLVTLSFKIFLPHSIRKEKLGQRKLSPERGL